MVLGDGPLVVEHRRVGDPQEPRRGRQVDRTVRERVVEVAAARERDELGDAGPGGERLRRAARSAVPPDHAERMAPVLEQLDRVRKGRAVISTSLPSSSSASTSGRRTRTWAVFVISTQTRMRRSYGPHATGPRPSPRRAMRRGSPQWGRERPNTNAIEAGVACLSRVRARYVPGFPQRRGSPPSPVAARRTAQSSADLAEKLSNHAVCPCHEVETR